MCGIAGFVIVDDDLAFINRERMTAVLAQLMKARGQMATGVCTVNPKGRVEVRKDALAADVFLAGRKGIGRSAQTCLIHTRQATKGTVDNHRNNHPIVYEDIIGIHNGMVRNDDDLFEHHKWPRKAQVDSEAIFASIHHYPSLADGLEAVDASWAIAWINLAINPKTLWLARGYGNPLHYARTKRGSTIFASTEHAVRAAFVAGGICTNPKEVTVIEAPLGFLACVDTDGKMDILPTFDGTGKKAIELPGKHHHYSHYADYGGWVKGPDGKWGPLARDRDAELDWERHTLGSSGKDERPRSGGGSVSEIMPAEGTVRGRHVVGEGWIEHVVLGGRWVKKNDVPAILAAQSPPPAASDDTADPFDQDALFDDSQIDPYGSADMGDRIAAQWLYVDDEGHSCSMEMLGTVIGVDEGGQDGLVYVDWDATLIDNTIPYRIIGSLAQKGA